jgi:hypothetical protein
VLYKDHHIIIGPEKIRQLIYVIDNVNRIMSRRFLSERAILHINY